MQENMDMKIIDNLKKYFRNNYESDLATYKNLENTIYSNPSEVTDEIRTEIEMYKIKAQTCIYAYKVIENCKTLEELKQKKEIIENSAFDYGKKYTKALKDMEEGLVTDSTYDMVCDKIKFYLLKDLVSRITEAIFLKEYSLYKLPQSEIENLGKLNKNIYELKLKLVKIPLNKVQEKSTIYEKLDNLIDERKNILIKYVGLEIADKLLNELEEMENNTSKSYDQKPKPSYYLTKEDFKDKLDTLNETIQDLKINRLKSATFYAMHVNDGKFNSVTLSKEILKYSKEREDIIKSVLGEDTPLLLTLKEISNLEGISNKNKKKSSLINDFLSNLSSEKALKECKKAIYDALESIFEVNDKIEIKSFEITYEEYLKKLEEMYNELPKEIEKHMIIQMGRKVKEDDERKKLMQLELTTVFDDYGTILENPLKGMKE